MFRPHCSTRFAIVCATVAALLLSAVTASAQRNAADSRELVTPQTRQAVDRGLRYLASQQHPDGAFGSGTLYRRDIGVTALCGMAFLAGGHLPGDGPYGRNLDLAVDYLIRYCDSTGFIHDPLARTDGAMYGHGFATTFLADVYGMSERRDLRPCLERAVKLILQAQNKEGGWRYEPRKVDADISVTVCQIMALRAAKNAGIHVPKEVIDNAVAYITKSQNTDGGFRYQMGRRPESAFARSAAAVVGLNSAGIYDGDIVDSGIEYLWRWKPESGNARLRPGRVDFYHYGHYYAVQAMWHSGGDRWPVWYAAVRDELLSLQQGTGSWPDDAVCREYGTAMACLVLEMPYNFLPIFQK